MQNTKHTHQTTIPVSSLLPSEEKSSSVPPPPNEKPLCKRLLRTVQRYPLPIIAVVLLLVSLMLWLTGRGDMASRHAKGDGDGASRASRTICSSK